MTTERVEDDQGLRRALAALPCCALGADGKTPGDPLNIVLIAEGDAVFHALIRRGWDPTETISGASMWRTIRSSLFGSRYRTSPVSALYLFGRPQDMALQRARASVDERNHLRLWLAPVVYKSKDVWVGQISRDIGVRFSAKTLVTHKIDPDVDETRDFLSQDLQLSGTVAKMGYIPGVGPATLALPRHNYTDDPYFTDGLRVVLEFSDDRVSPEAVRYFEWEWWPANQ
jgi:hypothetical protein